MALRFIDSFDHYLGVASGPGSEQATFKWTTATTQIRETGVHGYGMRGGFSKGMLFGSTTLIMEVYMKRLLAETIFSITDTNQSQQIHCGYTQLGQIEVSRYGSNPATDRIFQSAPDLIRENTWYHFGWKVTIHPTNGAVEVRLNGETICNLTGIPTITTLTPAASFWSGAIGGFSLGSNANATVYDDLVVMDDVDDGLNDPRLPGGGGFDKFLGAVEIVVKHPDGIGTSADWTPSPADPNWQNVNDPEPDGDSTVNNAAPTAVNASDLFAMEDLLTTQDVVAVQSLVCVRKTEEGLAAVSRLVRDAGTTTVGTPFYLPDSYSYLITPEPTLPDGTLWSRARWNAIEYGYRRIV